LETGVTVAEPATKPPPIPGPSAVKKQQGSEPPRTSRILQ